MGCKVQLTKKASMQEAMALRRDLPPRPLPPPPPPRGLRFPGKLLLRPYKPRKKHLNVKLRCDNDILKTTRVKTKMSAVQAKFT